MPPPPPPPPPPLPPSSQGPGLEHYGELILEGHLKLHDGGRKRERSFYLLEKLLVIVRTVDRSARVRVVERIVVSKSVVVSVGDCTEGEGSSLSFQITFLTEDHRHRTLIATAFNPDQKHIWTSTLAAQLERNARATFPSLPRELQDEIRSIASTDEKGGHEDGAHGTGANGRGRASSGRRMGKWLSAWGAKIRKKMPNNIGRESIATAGAGSSLSPSIAGSAAGSDEADSDPAPNIFARVIRRKETRERLRMETTGPGPKEEPTSRRRPSNATANSFMDSVSSQHTVVRVAGPASQADPAAELDRAGTIRSIAASSASHRTASRRSSPPPRRSGTPPPVPLPMDAESLTYHPMPPLPDIVRESLAHSARASPRQIDSRPDTPVSGAAGSPPDPSESSGSPASFLWMNVRGGDAAAMAGSPLVAGQSLDTAIAIDGWDPIGMAVPATASAPGSPEKAADDAPIFVRTEGGTIKRAPKPFEPARIAAWADDAAAATAETGTSPSRGRSGSRDDDSDICDWTDVRTSISSPALRSARSQPSSPVPPFMAAAASFAPRGTRPVATSSVHQPVSPPSETSPRRTGHSWRNLFRRSRSSEALRASMIVASSTAASQHQPPQSDHNTSSSRADSSRGRVTGMLKKGSFNDLRDLFTSRSRDRPADDTGSIRSTSRFPALNGPSIGGSVSSPASPTRSVASNNGMSRSVPDLGARAGWSGSDRGRMGWTESYASSGSAESAGSWMGASAVALPGAATSGASVASIVDVPLPSPLPFAPSDEAMARGAWAAALSEDPPAGFEDPASENIMPQPLPDTTPRARSLRRIKSTVPLPLLSLAPHPAGPESAPPTLQTTAPRARTRSEPTLNAPSPPRPPDLHTPRSPSPTSYGSVLLHVDRERNDSLIARCDAMAAEIVALKERVAALEACACRREE
ncbi:hypothetical protein BDK51DRAFT_32670 [Blyttiomyces helicus]|uniref:PH domain-containing protein n=1 Tax=Blyttiomyces helicus TaxID=388810 RepID=A0A4P9W2U9_9FUNG|nr:hypothetical protein BDK51DRAFT_32670 [Blyttiomyces helicus]|eukprot:RKO84930.1 hypothetical protein BDK51DRAFT_32670 [Blyttiomyces helicus]